LAGFSRKGAKKFGGSMAIASLKARTREIPDEKNVTGRPEGEHSKKGGNSRKKERKELTASDKGERKR